MPSWGVIFDWVFGWIPLGEEPRQGDWDGEKGENIAGEASCSNLSTVFALVGNDSALMITKLKLDEYYLTKLLAVR